MAKKRKKSKNSNFPYPRLLLKNLSIWAIFVGRFQGLKQSFPGITQMVASQNKKSQNKILRVKSHRISAL